MKHILMVDDVATNLRCAAEILQDDYEVSTARSGEKALELLQDMVPDGILLDINMPGMSGFEVFETIKTIPDLAGVPVIFITAETGQGIEEQAKESGAADFIRKPYGAEELKSRIEKALQKGEEKESVQKKAAHAQYMTESEKQIRSFVDEVSTQGYFLYLSLENFEQIKVIFGDKAEADLLEKITEAISNDTGCGKHLSRMKDGRFIIYLDGMMKESSIKSIVRKMIAELEFEINETISDEFEVRVAVLTGIAKKPEDGKTYEALRQNADKALYFAKESGKGRYHFYGSKQTGEHDGADDKESISFFQLKYLLEKNEGERVDSTESLQKAYRVVSRYWENTGGESQIIFFEIKNSDAQKELPDLLFEVISSYLRKGDVSVKCSRQQYLAVLRNTSPKNGKRAAERIKKEFEERAEDEGGTLIYEIKSV